MTRSRWANVDVRRREAGFTLPEMIVAMVLGTMALTTTSTIFVTLMQGSSKASATVRASQRSADTIDQFGTDLRSARSPDRSPANIANNDSLRSWLLGTTQLPTLDLLDISYADANQIWFRSDVVPEANNAVPAAECVGYHLDSQGRLLRSVYSDWRACPGNTGTNCILLGPGSSSCALANNGNTNNNTNINTVNTAGLGSPIEEIVLIENPPANDRPANIFRYTLLQNTQPTKPQIDPNDCRRVVTNNPGANGVNNVLMATIDLRSYIVRGDSVGESSVRGSVTLRSRLSYDYQYALGCAF